MSFNVLEFTSFCIDNNININRIKTQLTNDEDYLIKINL